MGNMHVHSYIEHDDGKVLHFDRCGDEVKVEIGFWMDPDQKEHGLDPVLCSSARITVPGEMFDEATGVTAMRQAAERLVNG